MIVYPSSQTKPSAKTEKSHQNGWLFFYPDTSQKQDRRFQLPRCPKKQAAEKERNLKDSLKNQRI